jgi:hypothetical protein
LKYSPSSGKCALPLATMPASSKCTAATRAASVSLRELFEG